MEKILQIALAATKKATEELALLNEAHKAEFEEVARIKRQLREVEIRYHAILAKRAQLEKVSSTVDENGDIKGFTRCVAHNDGGERCENIVATENRNELHRLKWTEGSCGCGCESGLFVCPEHRTEINSANLEGTCPNRGC